MSWLIWFILYTEVLAVLGRFSLSHTFRNCVEYIFLLERVLLVYFFIIFLQKIHCTSISVSAS